MILKVIALVYFFTFIQQKYKTNQVVTNRMVTNQVVR